ncbi:uncharacterized protein LOC111307986 [Durio zibethinus]|uniref:Uncharacterized protein LOC111307986 n=1 Tax=Durio zibethinus TaxID=66656 RepID=A0A6P6AB75_DURZI|nr:uncharacterized protein LOC111307986 [Durio zibethinus]
MTFAVQFCCLTERLFNTKEPQQGVDLLWFLSSADYLLHCKLSRLISFAPEINWKSSPTSPEPLSLPVEPTSSNPSQPSTPSLSSFFCSSRPLAAPFPSYLIHLHCTISFASLLTHLPPGPSFFWPNIINFSKILEFIDTLLIILGKSKNLVRCVGPVCQIVQLVFSFLVSVLILHHQFTRLGCSGIWGRCFNAVFNASLLALFLDFDGKSYANKKVVGKYKGS